MIFGREKSKHQNSEKSIVTQTAFRVSVVFICALILLTALFTIYIVRYMKNNILEEKKKQTETIAETVNSDIESLTTPIISLSSYSPVIRLLNDYDAKYSKEWMQNIRNIDNYLLNVNLFYDDVIDILLIQPDSRIVYSMSDRMNVEYDYTGQVWFQKALEQDGAIKYAYHSGGEFFYQAGEADTLSAIYPVSRADKRIGYILYEYDLSKIAAFFKEPEGSDSGYILIDDMGNQIFDYQKQREQQSEFQTQMLKAKQESKGKTFLYQDYLYLFFDVPVSGWSVLSENTNRSINGPVILLLEIVTGVLLLVVLLLIFISWYSAKRIKEPYDALIQRIISFDGNNAAKPYDYRHAPKELYTIGTKFEEMSNKINALIKDVYLAQLSRKEMELEAMTNQINPHFLYNVFQLIQTEAVMSDNLVIEEMIQKLSGMMRYTMERKREKVKIAEEIDYAQNYLMFYKERFEQMFTYEIQCDPDILECSTIKFILQPVLENCFKHGLKDVRSGGRISVVIKGVGDEIVFYVWDNGCGMTPEKLQEIKKSLSGSITENGIGIVNTNARLRLVYGPSYGIDFESEEGVYTKVTIRIRRERE